MAQLEVLFEVPRWVEAGVKSGQLSIFGGVVRDNAGRIAYMLKEGTKLSRRARGPWAIGILALAAAAGVGYAIYRVARRKPKHFELRDVDRAILTYASEAQAQRLTVEQIRALASELESLADAMESPELKDATFELDSQVASKLRDFYLSVRTFNLQLQAQIAPTRELPELIESDCPLALTRAIRDQLLFQQELWPAYAPPT